MIKKKFSNFYHNKNFLETSSYITTKKKFSVNNIYYKKIKNLSSFNTLIIDSEGAEEYYINNLTKLKNIKHILFELHNNIHNHKKIKEIFHILKKNKFKFNDKCFNSYYFKKIDLMKKILITGAAGFLGQLSINYFKKKYKLYLIDKKGN